MRMINTRLSPKKTYSGISSALLCILRRNCDRSYYYFLRKTKNNHCFFQKLLVGEGVIAIVVF